MHSMGHQYNLIRIVDWGLAITNDHDLKNCRLYSFAALKGGRLTD
jgi:hypothetical protein